MAKNKDVCFVSSSLKLPTHHHQQRPRDHSNHPFCSLTQNLSKTTESLNNFIASIANHGKPPNNTMAANSSLALSKVEKPSFNFPFSTWFGGRKRPTSEIQFKDLRCEGGNALPSNFSKDLIRDRYGKTIDTQSLNELKDSVNGWYRENGLFGWVADTELLPDGTVKVKISEGQVDNINLQFYDRVTGEPTSGKTRPETIFRRLDSKKGQIYNLNKARKDVETVWDMGIMEDVNIVPQQVGKPGKIDLTVNLVESVNSGFTPDIGFTTNGMHSGLFGRFEFFDKNLFGKNQKLNVAWEKGQDDSGFGVSLIDPAINDKSTSKAIRVQYSRTPTIDRTFASMEFSRRFMTKWKGIGGLFFKRSEATNGSTSGRDDMLVSRMQSEYSDFGDSKILLSMEQGLPLIPGWRCFNRVNIGARKNVELGVCRLGLKLSGGHMVGDFSRDEAFAIGGTDTVRGYEEGALGYGPSYVGASTEIFLPISEKVKGTLFADYGSNVGSSRSAGPGSGYGYGYGLLWDSPVGPLRLECAYNDKNEMKIHFGIGKQD